MAIDSRNLKPADLARLLNSTPLGTVLDERQLYRHRMRAGFRIGDGRRVDLFRYVAWLVDQRHAPTKVVDPSAEYEAIKERAAARNRALSEVGRDIGELPAVVDAARKAAAERSFERFCRAYFPGVFYLAWSVDHLKVVARIEEAVLHGGLFAMAMPRGSGKTTLCEIATLWAVLYGHRQFVALIGASEAHASEMLETLKGELEQNDLLVEDFPEAVFPIRCLEGISNRCAGQLYRGARTHIGWTATEVILPTIPGSRASGAIIRVAGITGRIRGMKARRADGHTVRPSLVVIDDPQTDESAMSETQCIARERVLNGAVLGLAGPGCKIAGLMTMTVIRRGDLADRLLDRQRSPQWQGERTRMVYAWPTDDKLWAQYAELRKAGQRSGEGTHAATDFYAANREAMDAGAVVAWPERYNDDELSAIQHAMNIRIDRGEAAFAAEYQNDPLPDDRPGTERLTSQLVRVRVNDIPYGTVPVQAVHVTASIDVHDRLLYWCVCAWEQDFTGAVVAYGTYPDQGVPVFTARDAPRSLAQAHPGAGREGAIRAGLEACVQELLDHRWARADGAVMRIDRMLVDAGYMPQIVQDVAARRGPVVMPSRGVGIRAGSRPMSAYTRKPGELHGLNWYVPRPARAADVRTVAYDANWWKTFVHARLSVPRGDRGALLLFGSSPERHDAFAAHVAESECAVETIGHGRVVNEWRPAPGRPDNHWFDCLVGCCVAASMVGVAVPGHAVHQGERRRLRLSELGRHGKA